MTLTDRTIGDDQDADARRPKLAEGQMLNTGDEGQGKVMTGQDKMTLTSRLLLSAVLMGAEAGTDFEQLYTVPNLQTLGMPLSLVSITGLISGPTATLLVLLMGCFSDRGSNPAQRRLWTLLLSTVVVVSGMLVVMSANLLHLNNSASGSALTSKTEIAVTSIDAGSMTSLAPSSVLSVGTSSVTSVLPISMNSPHSSDMTSEAVTDNLSVVFPTTAFVASGIVSGMTPTAPSGMTLAAHGDLRAPTYLASLGRKNRSPTLDPILTDVENHSNSSARVNGTARLTETTAVPVLVSPNASSTPGSSIRLTAGLGLLGYVLLDVGYDAVMASAKTWMLTCSPDSEHRAALAAGLVMTSLGGMLSAGLGVVDLASVFHLSSASRSSLSIQTSLQAVVVVVVVVVGVVCSILVGKKQVRHHVLEQPQDPFTADHQVPLPTVAPGHDTSRNMQHRATCDNDIEIGPSFQQGHKSAMSRLYEQRDALDSANRSSSSSVSSFSSSSSSPSKPSFQEDHSLLHSSVYEHLNTLDSANRASSQSSPLKENHSLPNSVLWERPDTLTSAHRTPSLSSRLSKEFATTSAKCYGTLDPSRTCSQDEDTSQDRQSTDSCSSEETGSRRELIAKRSSRCSLTLCRRKWGFKATLTILCVSAYLDVAVVVLYAITSSDFVAKVIYEGDPQAPAGSDSLARYQDGLRAASYGFLAYYVAYLLFSILQQRVLSVLGYTLEYVMAQLCVCVCLVVLAMTATMATFFLASAVAGIHRAVFHVVPFAVISDVIHAEASRQGEGRRPQLSLAMSAVTITLSLAYSTLYPWVGAVQDLTGVVAVPLWLAAGSACLSALLFLMLGL